MLVLSGPGRVCPGGRTGVRASAGAPGRAGWRTGAPGLLAGRPGAAAVRCAAARDGASGGGPGPAAAGSKPGQARPAVFWVRRETESMTTAASRTTPVIMDWTASLELPDM